MELKRIVKVLSFLVITWIYGYVLYNIYLPLTTTLEYVILTIIILFFSYFFFRIMIFIIWNKEVLDYWKRPEYKKRKKAKELINIPNRIHLYFIDKENWTASVYNKVGLTYLRNAEHTIEMLEKVLLLMHIESLIKVHRPLLRYKTHIYNKKIHLTFFSDLLRVRKPEYILIVRSAHSRDYYEYMPLYENMLKDYLNYTDSQLDELLGDALQDKTIRKNICFHRNYSKRMLFKARRWYDDKMDIKNYFFIFINFTSYICGIIYVIDILRYVIGLSLEISWLGTLLMIILVVLIRVYLYYRYNQPTEYERNHFYNKH